MKKVAFKTLGCKTNQYDSESMKQACRLAGFEVVSFEDDADAYIINTCTVTALADSQGRNLIRRARRRSPDALVIAVGCSVQNNRGDYESIKGVDAFFGVRSTDEIIEYLRKVCGSNAVTSPVAGMIPLPIHQSRARALLKIQDGCNRRCTYCAVWRVRGKSVSLPMDEVMSSYSALEEYPEVMLTGIHIGQYGYDLSPETTLANLLSRLVEIEDGPNIRLGSLDPDELDENLLSLMKSPKVCRHVHLSIQSGSNGVLRSMGRRYTADEIRGHIEALANSVDGVGIGVDLIAGFPGETPAQHDETVRLIEELPVSFLHVFPYSERPGTVAADLPDKVSHDERKRRAKELLDIGKAKKESFIRSMVGKTVDAIIISRSQDSEGMETGVSDNYLKVRFHCDNPSYRKRVNVTITGADGEEVRGRCG